MDKRGREEVVVRQVSVVKQARSGKSKRSRRQERRSRTSSSGNETSSDTTRSRSGASRSSHCSASRSSDAVAVVAVDGRTTREQLPDYQSRNPVGVETTSQSSTGCRNLAVLQGSVLGSTDPRCLNAIPGQLLPGQRPVQRSQPGREKVEKGPTVINLVKSAQIELAARTLWSL